jgi:hypothetical protein
MGVIRMGRQRKEISKEMIQAAWKQSKEGQLELALRTGQYDVASQIGQAIEQHPDPYHSPHEALGILAEELYEVLMAIHKRDLVNVREELLQIAAVATRAASQLEEIGGGCY